MQTSGQIGKPADSWSEARQCFLSAAERQNAEMFGLPADMCGPDGRRLVVDIAWIGSLAAPRVLVHISGLHGVEGFAGSLLQLHIINHHLPLERPDLAVVFIHSVNAFGMAYGRRWNEHNVDLNRNFLNATDAYAGASPLYPKLARWLSPHSCSRHVPFGIFAVWLTAMACRYGIATVAQAIAAGQYIDPSGLFFGGTKLEPASQCLLSWACDHLTDRQRVGVIDLHTGLGSFGQSTVIRPSAAAPATPDDLRPQRSSPSVAPYKARGDLVTALEREIPPCRGQTCVQEIGTYSMVYLLYLLREENLCWHRTTSPKRLRYWQHLLRNAFCPTNPRWIESLTRHGTALWKKRLQEIGE